MAKRMHWMPLDWPAYWADTRKWAGRPDLHGAYLNLLGAMWMERGPLPIVDEDLAGQAACTPEQWALVRDKVLPMFDVIDGKLHQKRLGAEFDHAQKVSEARRNAGSKGGKAKAENLAIGRVLPDDLLEQKPRQKQKQKHSTNVEDLLVHAAPAPEATQPAPKPAKQKLEYPQVFEDAWAFFPARAGSNSKVDGYRAWAARVKQGVDPLVMIDGVLRYGCYVKETGKLNTQFVMQAATFFGPSEHYRNAFDLPTPSRLGASSRADARTQTLNGLGTPTTGENHAINRTDAIDVETRVVVDDDDYASRFAGDDGSEGF